KELSVISTNIRIFTTSCGLTDFYVCHHLREYAGSKFIFNGNDMTVDGQCHHCARVTSSDLYGIALRPSLPWVDHPKLSNRDSSVVDVQ
ncbi:MAG: hypothetical protein QGF24_10220, partial [Dehalococcoidia bacterium]|nr:hypothetical protein [Dehalococcoidia bacterium]